MGIKQLYNDNLRKLRNNFEDVSVMLFLAILAYKYQLEAYTI